jgi:hypothetical protein
MTLEKKIMAIGWNALVDRAKGVALFLGETKNVGPYAFTSLEVVNKPTEAELMAALAGLKVEQLQKKK